MVSHIFPKKEPASNTTHYTAWLDPEENALTEYLRVLGQFLAFKCTIHSDDHGPGLLAQIRTQVRHDPGHLEDLCNL